jgi:hypothetical protein
MTHFVTITFPPHTNHSSRHSTTKVGLWARRFRISDLAKTSVSGHFREL